MSLSTLIVQREIASIREVEEALARQILYGGDLVTNLLEVCRLDETALLPIVAESLGLPPATPGELPIPDAESRRLVAAEVALERNLAPLSVDRAGLVIAVAEPLSSDVEQELSFALALPISQRIAPLVRIRQALARDYGVALDRRLDRLLRRMITEGPRTSSSFPSMRAADARLGAPRPPSNRPAIMPSRTSQSSLSASLRDSRTLVRPSAGATRSRSRRRGAITVDAARAELEKASLRDAIFDLLFEFARQYFDYTVVFIVHGEIAEGRDAFGDGAPREKVARIGVPLDLPSILSLAREAKTTIQKVPDQGGLDAVLMNDLGRMGKTTTVVLPVVVRSRVVALLLGEGGDSGVEASALADVEKIFAHGAAAFERLIVRQKRNGTSAPAVAEISPTAPPSAHAVRESSSGAIRRPLGTSIPREEPELTGQMPVTAEPAPLPPNAVPGPHATTASADEPATPPEPSDVSVVPSAPSSAGRSRARRGEAPKFEFQTAASRASDARGAWADAPADAPSGGSTMLEETPAVPPAVWSERTHADVADAAGFDPDATPIAPHVIDMDATPIAPSVWGEEAGEKGASAAAVPDAPRSPMPESEQRISISAHRPPSPRSERSGALPSVIVDVATEYVRLVGRVVAAASDDDAEAELLRAGGSAMPAIMAQFPGPTTVVRTVAREHEADAPLPRVADCGPVLRLIASQRRTALPFVLAYVEDADVERRFWATYLLTELVYPDVLEPILRRMLDEDRSVRRVARLAARAFAELHPTTLVKRLELLAIDVEHEHERRLLAIEALGETREALAVPALIPLLEEANHDVSIAVRAALVMITRQDFGTSSQKWRAWWAQNHRGHRLEWLIEALMHEHAALRAAAGEELKTTTKEYFGYYDDLPKRERERAQSRYREWWQSVGRVRFSRSPSRA